MKYLFICELFHCCKFHCFNSLSGDHSRVHLETVPNDYINASFIEVNKSIEMYLFISLL